MAIENYLLILLQQPLLKEQAGGSISLQDIISQLV
jgi:hypothetical protein